MKFMIRYLDNGLIMVKSIDAPFNEFLVVNNLQQAMDYIEDQRKVLGTWGSGNEETSS